MSSSTAIDRSVIVTAFVWLSRAVISSWFDFTNLVTGLVIELVAMQVTAAKAEKRV